MKTIYKIALISIAAILILASFVSVGMAQQNIDCHVYTAGELKNIVDVAGNIELDFVYDDNTTAVKVVNKCVIGAAEEYVMFEFYPSSKSESDYEPEFLAKSYPIVRMSYKTDINADSLSINAGMKASTTGKYERYWGLRNDDIVTDGTYNTVVYDLSDTSGYIGGAGTGWSGVTSDSGVKYICIPVWQNSNSLGSAVGEYINIEYIAFFKNTEDANKFVYEGDPFRPLGDADKDSNVTADDSLMLSKYLANWVGYNANTVNLSALDINDDKKINSADLIILFRNAASWKGYTDLSVFNPSYDQSNIKDKQNLLEVPDGLIEELDQKFADRVEKIRATKSEYTVQSGAKVYYVANDGDDNNDGLSEITPFKTLEKIERLMNAGTIRNGDVVLLRRGDEWHDQIEISRGITMSAYGEGDKPRILGSIEADDPSQWEATDAENVYKFKTNLSASQDVGNIVFDNGKAYGMRVIKAQNGNVTLSVGRDNITSNGINFWEFPVQAFTDYRDLAAIGERIPEADLMYYHDRENSVLYLYCREDNPGNVFESIELCRKGNTIKVNANNFTIDNVLFGYTGSHGLNSGGSAPSPRRNLTVRNCEICWIGGSVKEDKVTTRFGNAVQIYGAAIGFYVYDNYMYQCFDCGPTVQVNTKLKEEGKQVYHKDVEFYGNALAEASLEVWLTSSPANTETTFSKLVNCRLYDNYVTMSGYGWKGYNHQKNEWCSFYGATDSGTEYIDCYIENNYFWNLRRNLLKAVDTHTTQGLGFHWRNNVVIKDEGSRLGNLGTDLAHGDGGFQSYMYNETTIEKMLSTGTFGENTFYYVPDSYGYEVYRGPDYGNLAQVGGQ